MVKTELKLCLLKEVNEIYLGQTKKIEMVLIN